MNLATVPDRTEELGRHLPLVHKSNDGSMFISYFTAALHGAHEPGHRVKVVPGATTRARPTLTRWGGLHVSCLIPRHLGNLNQQHDENLLLGLTLLLTAAIATPAQGFTCTFNGADQGTCDSVAFHSARYDYLVVISDGSGLLDVFYVPRYVYRDEPLVWTPPHETNGTVEVEADIEAGYGMCVSDCFPSGTLVWTPDRLQPIETLSAGNLVIDPATGLATVIDQVIRSKASQLVTIFAKGGTLSATRGHEFHLASGAWVAADKLRVGDRLKTQSGQLVTIERVMASSDRCLRAVFNLRLRSGKAMCVGEQGVVAASSRTGSGRARTPTLRPAIARGSI